MKNYFEDIKNIPKHLCGNCYRGTKLCLFCADKLEEYEKNPFCLWEKLPEDCRFRGWVFYKQEEVKQKIRRKKEKILSLKVKLEGSDGIKRKRILKDIEKYQKEIDIYKQYGSENW